MRGLVSALFSKTHQDEIQQLELSDSEDFTTLLCLYNNWYSHHRRTNKAIQVAKIRGKWLFFTVYKC